MQTIAFCLHSQPPNFQQRMYPGMTATLAILTTSLEWHLYIIHPVMDLSVIILISCERPLNDFNRHCGLRSFLEAVFWSMGTLLWNSIQSAEDCRFAWQQKLLHAEISQIHSKLIKCSVKQREASPDWIHRIGNQQEGVWSDPLAKWIHLGRQLSFEQNEQWQNPSYSHNGRCAFAWDKTEWQLFPLDRWNSKKKNKRSLSICIVASRPVSLKVINVWLSRR